MKKKLNDILAAGMVVLVGLCILVPALTTTWKPDVVSDAENRKLQDWPTAESVQESCEELLSSEEDVSWFLRAETTVSSVTEQIEDFFSDRLGCRVRMISFNSAMQDKLFGFMNHPLYEYGKDGYVFFRYEDSHMNLDYIEDYASFVKQAQNYCEERGIEFLFVVSPSKEELYAEYLPDTIGEMEDYSALLKPYLEAEGVNYLYQADALFGAKGQGIAVFNKQYDSGHWNTEGMYAGASAVIDRLQEMGVSVEDVDLGDYEAVYTHQNYLKESVYPISEDTYRYERLENGTESLLVSSNGEDDLLLSDKYHTYHYYENDSLGSDESLLMFQGSYYNTQGTMLQHQFSQVAQVHAYYNVTDFEYYVDVFQPTVVIFETASYAIQNAYYPHELLRDAVFSDPYDNEANQEGFEVSLGDSAVLSYDDSGFINNFEVPWFEQTGLMPAYAYVELEDGTVLDVLANDEGALWWGCKTALLEDGALGRLMVMGEDGSMFDAKVMFAAV